MKLLKKKEKNHSALPKRADSHVPPECGNHMQLKDVRRCQSQPIG